MVFQAELLPQEANNILKALIAEALEARLLKLWRVW